jgi:hypothetical protein
VASGDLPLDEHAHTTISDNLLFFLYQPFSSYTILEFIPKFSVYPCPLKAQFVANNFLPTYLFIILDFDPYIFPNAQ